MFFAYFSSVQEHKNEEIKCSENKGLMSAEKSRLTPDHTPTIMADF